MENWYVPNWSKNFRLLERQIFVVILTIFIRLEFVWEMTSKCHFCFESAGVFCKLIMIQHLLSNWVDNTVSEPLSVCLWGLRKLFWSFFGQKFVVYNIFTNICAPIYEFWQLIELLKHDFCFTSHAVFCFTWGTNQILLSVFWFIHYLARRGNILKIFGSIKP